MTLDFSNECLPDPSSRPEVCSLKTIKQKVLGLRNTKHSQGMDDVQKTGRLSKHLQTHFVPRGSKNTGSLACTFQAGD